jgi:hypothetical protein
VVEKADSIIVNASHLKEVFSRPAEVVFLPLLLLLELVHIIIDALL